MRFYRGSSMAGTFRPGDRLTVVAVQLAEIEPGDVVVYRAEAGELVHRVVAVATDGLVARGDSNPHPDDTPVTAENLLGRVTHVERDGHTIPVPGGRAGLLRARLLHARHRAWRLARRRGGGPYRWLRASGLVRRWWHPELTPVRFETGQGPLLKYLHRGRTVACWWPGEDRFECRHPYDLVLSRPTPTRSSRTDSGSTEP